MRKVGFLVNHPEGLEGERGMFFDYILGANGLFIEASSPLLTARAPVSLFDVRGLAPLGPMVYLPHGHIPRRYFELAMDIFYTVAWKEWYVAVTWRDRYRLHNPNQTTTATEIEYSVPEGTVLDLHSHGQLMANFSTRDNQDEQGLKLYGVVGRLGELPELRLRVGVYGYFSSIPSKDVFDGYLSGVIEKQGEEVMEKDELHSEPTGDMDKGAHHPGGLWWNRWFRR